MSKWYDGDRHWRIMIDSSYNMPMLLLKVDVSDYRSTALCVM
jgi:hypothetical protein